MHLQEQEQLEGVELKLLLQQLKKRHKGDTKSLLQAIEKRFGGNAATKKTQRNLLKQQRDGLEVADGYANNEGKEILKEHWKKAYCEWNRENTRRVVPVKTTTSNALGSHSDRSSWNYDCCDQAIEGPTKLCTYDLTLLQSLESVEARLLVYKKNESVYEEDIKLLKREIYLKEVAITELRRKLELAQKQKDEIQLTVEKLKNSSKSLSKLIDCQIVDKCKTGLGYNAVPPPYTGNFMPPKPNLSFSSLEEFVNEPIVSEPTVKKPVVETSEAKASADKPKVVRKNNGAPIIEDWVSDSEEEDMPQAKIQKKTVKPSFAKIEFVKSKEQVKSPRKTVNHVNQNRQNTHTPRGNQRNWNNMMSQRLGSNFEMFNKACYVCGSFDHLQYNCDNHQRQFNNKKMVKLVWNYTQRVNHQNFSRMTHPSPKRNMVPKAVLMRSGLVSLTTARPVNTAQPRTTVNSARPMTNVFNKAHSTVRRPINNKTTTKNILNAVSGNQLIGVSAPACIGAITNDLQDQGVIDNRCSRHMRGNMSYFTDFDEIDRGYVAFGGNPKGGKITGRARTPQQNGVAKKKNRTLIKAARTILADSKLPTTFWAESVNTACYVQNRITYGRVFDGKDDEGFFVGYSINSKAFRVFNSRTRIVKENTHVQFSENTPNITGSGPDWLFDNDALTKSMNYKPVVAGNQSNGNAGTKECDDVGKSRMETVPGKYYILLPLWPADLPFSQNSKSSPDAGFKPSVDNKNKKLMMLVQKTSIELPDDPNMPELEDIVYSDDDEDVGAEDDMNNLNTFMPVSPIPSTRIHKDHPVEQIIRDLNSTPQTRRMIKNLEEHGYTQEEGIYYNEVFALGARIEAIRLFLAYASFKDFVVYQMDVKSAFLCGVPEEIYVCQTPGFEDLDFPDRMISFLALQRSHYALSKLFVQLLEARKKHFASKRAEEERNKPPTKAQRRSIMYDGDDVTIEATPLSTKSPTIVDYKVYKEGKKSYFSKLVKQW
ncbi:ribonuclease H-like domain-containing protein [Tanacetum coccineum]|uniref:Ribonuclease H-like domain-containing protein n=1 Tax=Tanacetum coccineum TaxID=301880 RepID=A0ABQ5DU54_9ASTR